MTQIKKHLDILNLWKIWKSEGKNGVIGHIKATEFITYESRLIDRILDRIESDDHDSIDSLFGEVDKIIIDTLDEIRVLKSIYIKASNSGEKETVGYLLDKISELDKKLTNL